MKFLFFYLTAIFACNVVRAQCLSGDCDSGWGKYEFGNAVYEGSFKKGKPDGFGKMTYSNGEEYQGPFEGGEKHGLGTIIKNGEGKMVKYLHGILQSDKIVVDRDVSNVKHRKKKRVLIRKR